MNSSLVQARQALPAFSGVSADPGRAQALASIAIGEILEQILAELQKQNTLAQQQVNNAPRVARTRPRESVFD